MKILLVSNHLKGHDGYSRYTLALLSNLQKKGHEVRVIVHEPTPQYKDVEYAVLGPSPKYLLNVFEILRGAFYLQRAIRTFSPDIVHFVVEPYAHMSLCIPKGWARFVMTVHGTYAYMPNVFPDGLKKKLSVLLTRLLYRRVDRVIAVSNFTREHLLTLHPEPESLRHKVIAIPNGIDLSVFGRTPYQRTLREGSRTLLSVGPVTERKGTKELLNAFAQYLEKYGTDTTLTIVGAFDPTSVYGEEVEALVTEKKLEDKVRFQGRLSDEALQAEYQKADVFLLLSINRGREFEGFGLVYLEANAAGLPVIGSTGSGTAEAIKDGHSGYVVHPEDSEAIAEKLHALLWNPEEYERMSKGALEWAHSFAWDRQIEKYLESYKASPTQRE